LVYQTSSTQAWRGELKQSLEGEATKKGNGDVIKRKKRCGLASMRRVSGAGGLLGVGVGEGEAFFKQGGRKKEGNKKCPGRR